MSFLWGPLLVLPMWPVFNFCNFLNLFKPSPCLLCIHYAVSSSIVSFTLNENLEQSNGNLHYTNDV